MLKIIRSILQKFIDDIDADNSNLSYEQQYNRDGFIPRGRKLEGFKELRWYKSDLDLFLVNQ